MSALALVGALAWTAACTWYALRARWWRYAEGRNAMFVGVILAVLCWGHVFDIHTHVVLWFAVALAGVHRLVLIESAQRASRAATTFTLATTTTTPKE